MFAAASQSEFRGQVTLILGPTRAELRLLLCGHSLAFDLDALHPSGASETRVIMVSNQRARRIADSMGGITLTMKVYSEDVGAAELRQAGRL